MSTIGNALNNWLQRYNTSVMRQEVSVCDRFPPDTIDAMIDTSIKSATKITWGKRDPREMGAPITKDYTLGNIRTGTIDKVLIPRPLDTIGTFHTHVSPSSSFPSVGDTLEAIKYNDKIMCIGAHGKAGTKVQCFTPNKPKWDEFQYKFRLLVDDIKDYNKKVNAKFSGTAPEKLLRVARTEPSWYEEGKELQKRRNALEGEIKAQLRELASPKEWKAQKWANGFTEAPFFEVHPNAFDKCRIAWETYPTVEELGFEL